MKPTPGPHVARAVMNAVLLAATKTDARLPADGSVNAQLVQAIGDGAIEAAREDVAQGRNAHASWGGLAMVRLGLAANPEYSAVADEALVGPGLKLVHQRVGAATTGAFKADELKELLAACQVLDEGPQSLLAAVRHQAFVQEQTVLDAMSATPPPPLRAEIEKAGGVGVWLERHDAELGWLDKLAAAPPAPAPAVMADFERERKKIWGEGSPSLSLLLPQTYARWALREARLKGTCLAIALAADLVVRGELAPSLAALSPAVLPAPPLDLLSAGPWEYTPDGVGGRLLRSGPVELNGKVERVELGIDAPPPGKAAKPGSKKK